MWLLEPKRQRCCIRYSTSQKPDYPVRKSGPRKSLPSFLPITLLTTSAPGLVFWFADAEASSATSYPPTTFRWIDNQKEAEEAVDAAKKKAARRAAGEE